MFDANIVLDSLAPCGVRLTTFELTYPRFVHAELMTHRVFSRNAASSRAIPTSRLLEAVRTNPAMPVYWGKNQTGMQAAEELTGTDRYIAEQTWLAARDEAVLKAEAMLALGVHKQILNRILEPWMHITVIVTATTYANWFKLRAHPDAQPEIRVLAERMLEEYKTSTPHPVQAGQWHIPYVRHRKIDKQYVYLHDDSDDVLAVEEAKKVGTARCARVSYVRQLEKKPLYEDSARHDSLATSGHWSPFEHSAMALGTREQIGNFRGWLQHRKMFPGESGEPQ